MKQDKRDPRRQQDQKPHEQGRDPREMTKSPDRDMGKNRNEEETGEPVQLGKEGRKDFEEPAEGEGRGPQLP
jgi:hypothetical protein